MTHLKALYESIPYCAIALLIIFFAGHTLAGDMPATLPTHDGKAGLTTKPVKVYLLAGQSNMVGMGQISGAKNLYNSIYLTSDPDVPTGPMTVWKVGSFKVLPLTVYDTAGKQTTRPIEKGTLAVPLSGEYKVQVGPTDMDYSIKIDGKAVGETIKLTTGKRYAFEIVMGPRSRVPRFWMQKTDMLGNGDLEAVVKREGMFPWLIDAKGEWVTRSDVFYRDPRIRPEGKGSLLSPASNNGQTIGPELGFGHVMGTFHDEQVLLIKTSMGNRALGFDFRPPSSGRTDPDSEWESLEYRLMVEGVNKTLADIDKLVPGYKGQGYEIAGFVWWQGHKDGYSEQLIADYEKNLVNLINDVRKEFKVPNMPAVVATVGFGGNALGEGDKYIEILKAQMAVADHAKHPAFAGKVASVDTRGYWRETDASPKGEGHHYNRNAETYYRVGDAMGRAMVRLVGGKADPLVNPNVHRPTPKADEVELTDEQKAKQQAALAPILLDSIAVDYVNNPRYSKALLLEVKGQRPSRSNQFLQGAMYGLINTYNAAGNHDYDWKAFGPDLLKTNWHYMSFDPKEPYSGKGGRFRSVTWPEGSAKWIEPGFDAGKAGWKTGMAPFGSAAGELKPLRENCTLGICLCGTVPKTLWEKEVLAVRTTIDVPKLKEGHRYRIVIGGSAHVNAGEGYAIYVDGKLVNESNAGVGKRQGAQPRGGHLYADVIDELKDGKATIAVYSFQRFAGGAGPFPNGHLTVMLHEQKLPPIQVDNE